MKRTLFIIASFAAQNSTSPQRPNLAECSPLSAFGTGGVKVKEKFMQQLQLWLLRIPDSNEDDQRRGRIIIVLALLMSGLALLSIPLVFAVTPQLAFTLLLINVTGVLVYTIVIVLCRTGWVQAGGLLFIITVTTLTMTILFLAERDDPTRYATPFFLVFTILITGMILPPAWTWFALFLNTTGLLAGWWTTGQLLFFKQPEGTLQIAALFLQVGSALFTFVGGSVTNAALREARRLREEARQSANQLAALNATLEAQVAQRTAALQQALRDLEQRAAEQARLLAENEQQRQVIRELSVPVLPVRTTTLVMPLIGALDTDRLADMQRQALTHIERTGAREFLIDVTGVPVIDTQVAKGVIQLVEAARLMGAHVTLVGIRPEVAQTLVMLGIDLRGIRTFSTLQAALKSNR
jgi:rsbT co-antagonist protein RsbR